MFHLESSSRFSDWKDNQVNALINCLNSIYQYRRGCSPNLKVAVHDAGRVKEMHALGRLIADLNPQRPRDLRWFVGESEPSTNIMNDHDTMLSLSLSISPYLRYQLVVEKLSEVRSRPTERSIH